jgi:hypothetical protein
MQGLRVHAVSVVELGQDLLLLRAVSTGTYGSAPTPVSNLIASHTFHDTHFITQFISTATKE